MPINRRFAVKQLLVFSAGVALLPSCMHDTSKASIILKHISLSGHDEKLLAALANAIIPTNDTPGASSIGSHLFAMTMLDDCYSKADQDKFKSGMEAFEKRSNESGGNNFTKLTDADRQKLLTGFEASKDEQDPANYFYRTMKHLTIQSYVTSPYYLKKVQVYELVPSRWHGCVPVTSDLKKAS